MAHDDRSGRSGRDGARAPQWRGDDSFGGGWGNQTPRPQRLGDRGGRPLDDPDHGAERYGAGPAEGYGGESYGPTGDPGSFALAPGYDAGFGGPRFDRVDVGSTGTHGVHPVSSPFGGGRGPMGITPGGGWGSSARLYAELRRGQGGEGTPRPAHDPDYAEWRRRQVERLDRDYDDYRREQQARFDREFGEWRERRGEQRRALGRVTEHMEVVGSDGGHVGAVDCIRDDALILTKSDAAAGGHHHAVPCGWVEAVDDKVRLNLTAGEAMRRWRDEERSGALFDRGGRGGDERGRDQG